MNVSTQLRNRLTHQRRTALSIAVLVLMVSVGCSPVSTQPSLEPTLITTEPQAAPTAPVATATSEEQIPAGWTTHTSQRCEYAISFPSEMQVNTNGTYSRTLEFELSNPDEGARNFIYVSVIDQEIQSMDEEGVYNYDPAEAEILINMQVGESKAVREVSNVAQWFTYQRLLDTSISSNIALTFENTQPWEFPEGTKEMRYYLSLDGCTYLIGGYMDTTGSDQPGAITEELFNQIVATIQLTP